MQATTKSPASPLSPAGAVDANGKADLLGQPHPERIDVDPAETEEWIDSLEAVLHHQGPQRAQYLLEAVMQRANRLGVRMPFTANTPYLNTIPLEDQPEFPGDRELERKIKSVVRWNAMAMVARANKNTNVGGHIATFASATTLYTAQGCRPQWKKL